LPWAADADARTPGPVAAWPWSWPIVAIPVIHDSPAIAVMAETIRSIPLGILPPDAFQARPRAGMALVWPIMPYRRSTDSSAMVVLAETLRTLQYSLLILWPFLRSFHQDYLDAAALDGQGHRASSFAWCSPLFGGRAAAAGLIAWRSGWASCRRQPGRTAGYAADVMLIWSLLHTGVESHYQAWP